MSEIFLDTNVILRYLLKDNKYYYRQAKALFLNARSKRQTIRLIPQVVFEVVFVLEKLYKIDRTDIADNLKVLLAETYIKTTSKKELLCALDFYASDKSLSLVDIYLSCLTSGARGELVTFDQKLEKFHKKNIKTTP